MNIRLIINYYFAKSQIIEKIPTINLVNITTTSGRYFQMIGDLNTSPDNLALQSDICIVGAGAAGILIARGFLGTNRKIILLESGGVRSEDAVGKLHEGEVHDRSFRGLQNGGARVFGGTTTRWGGQCIPLDSIDFEDRYWVPSSGRPIPADTDCQVFGVDGLFIAGGSVFPTSGAANPRLTIAAMAIRLADKMKMRLGLPAVPLPDELSAKAALRVAV
jgi:choline dehydrogenase-like flavoprotein